MQIHAQAGEHPTAGWRDYMLLLLISFLSGSSFTLTSLAVHDVLPLAVVATRLLIAMMIFIAFFCPAEVDAWQSLVVDSCSCFFWKCIVVLRDQLRAGAC